MTEPKTHNGCYATLAHIQSFNDFNELADPGLGVFAPRSRQWLGLSPVSAYTPFTATKSKSGFSVTFSAE